MRLVLDPAACDGFGFCAEILPEALAPDEWGFPVVQDGEIPADLVRIARQAVRACPRRALQLDEPVPVEVRHLTRARRRPA